MLRLFLGIVGSLFMLCTALVGGTHILATHDPPPYARVLLPDPACPAPCWQGFRPGYTPAPDRILPAPESVTAVVMQAGSPAYTVLELRPTGDVKLGDVLAGLGAPDAVEFTESSGQRGALEIRLIYLDEYLTVTALVVMPPSRLLELPVIQVTYQAQPLSRPVLGFDWRDYPDGVKP